MIHAWGFLWQVVISKYWYWWITFWKFYRKMSVALPRFQSIDWDSQSLPRRPKTLSLGMLVGSKKTNFLHVEMMKRYPCTHKQMTKATPLNEKTDTWLHNVACTFDQWIAIPATLELSYSNLLVCKRPSVSQPYAYQRLSNLLGNPNEILLTHHPTSLSRLRNPPRHLQNGCQRRTPDRLLHHLAVGETSYKGYETSGKVPLLTWELWIPEGSLLEQELLAWPSVLWRLTQIWESGSSGGGGHQSNKKCDFQ